MRRSPLTSAGSELGVNNGHKNASNKAANDKLVNLWIAPQIAGTPERARTCSFRILRPKHSMTAILADFDPGTLTGFYALLLSGLGVVFCLALAGMLALGKNKGAARRSLLAAGAVAIAGVLLAWLAVALGQRLHLL